MIDWRAFWGMNHIRLPGKADLKHFDNDARYAVNMMEFMINRMMILWSRRLDIAAKVLEGSCSSGNFARALDGRQKFRVCP